MDHQPHPTHHFVFARAMRFAVAAGVLAFVANLLILQDYNKAIVTTAITFILIVVATIVWAARQCRSAVCPTCGKTLPRDTTAPHGECHYPCVACQTVWVSQVRTTGF